MKSLDKPVRLRVVGCGRDFPPDSNLPISAHGEEVNCAPLSDVRLLGILNLETHPRMRALAQDVAVISSRGTASGHLDHLSIIVNR